MNNPLSGTDPSGYESKSDRPTAVDTRTKVTKRAKTGSHIKSVVSTKTVTKLSNATTVITHAEFDDNGASFTSKGYNSDGSAGATVGGSLSKDGSGSSPEQSGPTSGSTGSTLGSGDSDQGAGAFVTAGGSCNADGTETISFAWSPNTRPDFDVRFGASSEGVDPVMSGLGTAAGVLSLTLNASEASGLRNSRVSLQRMNAALAAGYGRGAMSHRSAHYRAAGIALDSKHIGKVVRIGGTTVVVLNIGLAGVDAANGEAGYSKPIILVGGTVASIASAPFAASFGAGVLVLEVGGDTNEMSKALDDAVKRLFD